MKTLKQLYLSSMNQAGENGLGICPRNMPDTLA